MKMYIYRIDLSELLYKFDEFSKSEMIGIGVDLSPTYFIITEKYR